MTPSSHDKTVALAEDVIDQWCDRFEAEWLRGGRPTIGNYLSQSAPEHRVCLYSELLLVELEYRRKAGESPTLEEYLRAYPEYAAQTEAVRFARCESAFVTDTTGSKETIRAAPHEPGKRIAHFSLEERLGAGAMGEVWKAWDPRLRRFVTIKLPRAGALTAAELARFLREGQAAAQLRHPHLASVHEVGRDGDTAYIIADYVEGRSLEQYLSSHQLRFAAMAELCAQIADALDHAHDQGVLHRDLKPANIIISPDGRAHVIDFGLAKWSTDESKLTMHGELLGTPAYMSPEQARGEGAGATRATDIYSLGVILYEMLTGQCPYSGDRGAVIHQILNRDPPRPRSLSSTVPRDLETICLKAIDKAPPRRYATARAMADDLRRFATGEPILARRVGLLERGWRWVRRRPAWAAACALALVAVGASLLAGAMAERNRALLGYKTVKIATDPSGAQLAFARLGEIGELLDEPVTFSRASESATMQLLPGDYFVEALWPDGRFHQVLRNVPVSGRPGRGVTMSPLRGTNELGVIVLPDIDAPAETVTSGMSLMTHVLSDRPHTIHSRQSFYVDSHEVLTGEVRAATKKTKEYKKYQFLNQNDDEPVRESFGYAADIAEALGKRLLFDYEYEQLAAMRGSVNQPTSPAPGPARGRSTETRPIVLRYGAQLMLKLPFRCARSERPMFIPLR